MRIFFEEFVHQLNCDIIKNSDKQKGHQHRRGIDLDLPIVIAQKKKKNFTTIIQS
jgi:hypothetical protein